MVGGWTYWMLFLFFVQVFQAIQANDCWEPCFGPDYRNGNLKDEYIEILDLIENMRAAAQTSAGTGSGASNGTTLLMDVSTPSGASPEKQELTLALQRRLAQILSFTMSNTLGTNPLFFIKYDGTRSWYCYEWACLGRCDAYSKLETEYDKFSTVSDATDLLDDSCRAAAYAMDIDDDNPDAGNYIACHQFTFNEMVVALVNSPFKTAASCDEANKEEIAAISQLDGRGGFEDFIEGESGFGNWCERKFAKRVAVGTLYADQEEMENFATVQVGTWPGSTYIRESADVLEAANEISTCMNDLCCPGISRRQKRQATGDTCVEFKDATLNTFSPS